MKPDEISIAVDIDGVIADFEGEFCERFGHDNRHMFDLCSRYPDVDRELIEEFVHNPSTYEDLVPIFGGILLANQIRQFGFNLVIMTSRPKGVAEITDHFLKQYDIRYGDIAYAWDKAKTIEDYNTIYTNHPIKVLIDDNIKNMEGLPSNVVGMVWEQPWNVGYFPRVRYNPDTMKIEKCDTVSSPWKYIWSNK